MGHVRDRWMTTGPSGRKVRNERWGKGMRWQAKWINRGREVAKTFPTRDGAEAHLARMVVNPTSVRSSQTVTDYAANWRAEQLHYAPSTVQSVEHRMAKMVLPELGAMPLAAVTRADVQRLVMVWSASYSAASVHQAYSFLTTMFAAALRDGLVPSSPCVAVNLPTVERARIRPVTADQVAAIASRVQLRYRSMVVVGAASGLRGAELRGLTVDRLIGGDVLVDRQLEDVRNGAPVFGPPKSAAGFRRLSLGRVASEVLEDHLQQFPPEGLIWVTRQGGPVNRKRAAEIWQAATAGMGLRPRSGWHELRHHHASLLIDAGFSAKAVAERLGHADPAETWRTYAHLWPADHDRMTDAVDAALGALRPQRADVIPLRRRG